MSELRARIRRCLANWPYSDVGSPSTWAIARGIGKPAGAVAITLSEMEDDGIITMTGRDRVGARQWHLTDLGRSALSEKTGEGK